MSKIAILTDSSCDIPQEMAEKYGIDIMSFHILLDDVDYVERESCTNTEFYDKMRAAKGVPSTAAITPIQFCEKYCQYVDEGYTDVIHVPINKSGSSTYNNALMAQGMLREERTEPRSTMPISRTQLPARKMTSCFANCRVRRCPAAARVSSSASERS